MRKAMAGDKRTPERLRHHYEVERALAARLKATRSHAERAPILATMYQELFAQVPDHPRLTARADPIREHAMIQRQMALLRPCLRSRMEYVEFGAGSCAFTFEVCRHVRRGRAVEIADQIAPGAQRPANFELVTYDGYHVDLPADSVDLVFSNQFVEHLHPDDAEHHFASVQRILRRGGRYVLTTPERWTGPHDISRWFSETAQGFHLHEWTYGELVALSRRLGFRPAAAWWMARGIAQRVPLGAMRAAEWAMARMNLRLRRSLGHVLIPDVVLALEKL